MNRQSSEAILYFYELQLVGRRLRRLWLKGIRTVYLQFQKQVLRLTN